MQTVILPVFDEKDLSAIPNCLRFLANSGTEVIMILHNPNVGITDGDLTKPFEERVTQLQAAKTGAVAREDYDAAKEYAKQIEDTKTERDIAVRDGWSQIPEQQRMAIYRKVLDPTKLGTEAIFPLRENYPHDQVFRALHELQSTWPRDLEHGQFSLVWPRSVPEQVVPRVIAQVTAPAASTAMKTPEFGKALSETDVSIRRETLRRRHLAYISACKKHGIDPKGEDKSKVIDLIIQQEFPKAA